MASPLVKDPNTLLNDMLRSYKAGLTAIVGIPNPMVDPGSEVYNRFQTISNEIGIGLQNVVVQGDSQMPDTATGTDLDRITGIYGLQRRPSTSASGFITLVSSQSVVIPSGTQLISTVGLIYQVSQSGTYANGASVPVRSVDTGFKTNLSAGTVLTWLNTPAFTQPTATVVIAIVGGTDPEDDNTLRARLLNALQNIPQFGNWADVANLSESFDPAVQKSFIYPTANGPATQHIALMGYATSTNKNRDIPSANLTNLTSQITGNLPAYTNTVVTTVANVAFSAAFKLTIPYPQGASSLGFGTGWLDISPFPIPNATGAAHDGSTNFAFCSVGTVTSATSFTIQAPLNVAPFAGLTRISWINQAAGWVVTTATILTTSGTGPYTVTIDNPFPGVQAGDFIFPASTNGQNYLNAALTHFSQMGPGEKTNAASIEPMASRKPLPSLSYPNTVDATILRAVINSGNEVLDCDFYARRANGAEIGIAAPALPTVITDPPKIYVPAQIGFYPPNS